MSGDGAQLPLDWSGLRLVVFDVDGTLYDQRALRLRMIFDLARHLVEKREGRTLKIIGAYRKLRERLGEEEVENFEEELLRQTARKHDCAPNDVRAAVEEWIERRPLAYLAGCRYPALPALFAALRRAGKRIAIFSDYPAEAKMAAMGLDADLIVSAGDDGVGVLKPNPRGLQRLIETAKVDPAETILIGDRVERDGLAAQRAGAEALIRTSKPIEGWRTFRRFDDPVFSPLLAPAGA